MTLEALLNMPPSELAALTREMSLRHTLRTMNTNIELGYSMPYSILFSSIITTPLPVYQMRDLCGQVIDHFEVFVDQQDSIGVFADTAREKIACARHDITRNEYQRALTDLCVVESTLNLYPSVDLSNVNVNLRITNPIQHDHLGIPYGMN